MYSSDPGGLPTSGSAVPLLGTSRGALLRWGHKNQAKSILVSSCGMGGPCGRWSPGWGSPALGVGCTAGAAAGFAVVPVAAQVHLDGQGTVGSCLVLAAVVWGRENTRMEWKGKRHRHPPAKYSDKAPIDLSRHIVSHCFSP